MIAFIIDALVLTAYCFVLSYMIGAATQVAKYFATRKTDEAVRPYVGITQTLGMAVTAFGWVITIMVAGKVSGRLFTRQGAAAACPAPQPQQQPPVSPAA